MTTTPIHTLPIPAGTRAKRFLQKHKEEIVFATVTTVACTIVFFTFKKGTEALVARGMSAEENQELDQLIKEYAELTD